MLTKDDPLSANHAPDCSPDEFTAAITHRNKAFLDQMENHRLIPICVLKNVQPGRPVIFVWRSNPNSDAFPDRYYL